MANVSDNEERYMRELLLLGKGGCLVLRGLVNREVDKDEQKRSLKDILRTSKSKLNLRGFELNYVFPSGTEVNDDVETWDISLLIRILNSKVFQHITKEENDAVTAIRTIRNKFQGHTPSYSLEEMAYKKLRLELTELFFKLSDEDTKMKCLDIISYTGAGMLTNDIVLKELNAVHAFGEDEMSLLKERFENQEKKQYTEILKKMKEIKTQNIYLIRQNATKELQTIIQAQCDEKEKEKKAIDVLYDVITFIQDSVEFSEDEIRKMIKQRIEWYGELTLELMKDVLEWFKDVQCTGASPGKAELGSIRIPITCSSEAVLKTFMKYMDSTECQRCLSDISSTLSRIICFSCSLSWTVEPLSTGHVLQAVSREVKTAHKESESKKILLPFQVASVKESEYLRNMFMEEKRNKHLASISDTLSRICGVKISLMTSIDKDQKALCEKESQKRLKIPTFSDKELQVELYRWRKDNGKIIVTIVSQAALRLDNKENISPDIDCVDIDALKLKKFFTEDKEANFPVEVECRFERNVDFNNYIRDNIEGMDRNYKEYELCDCFVFVFLTNIREESPNEQKLHFHEKPIPLREILDKMKEQEVTRGKPKLVLIQSHGYSLPGEKTDAGSPFEINLIQKLPEDILIIQSTIPHYTAYRTSSDTKNPSPLVQAFIEALKENWKLEEQQRKTFPSLSTMIIGKVVNMKTASGDKRANDMQLPVVTSTLTKKLLF